MTDAPLTPPPKQGLLEPGTIISDRYRVERLIGEGGMGTVYLVEHVQLKKRFALKVLLPEMSANPEVVARFEREAVAAANLDHPNVVSATDFGRTANGALFLVLEYVEGQSLRKAIEAGPMEVGRALSLARQMAAALVRAQMLGIVHRDLKPENVMLVNRDGLAEVVKVLDFGIAKMTKDRPSGERVQEQGQPKNPLTRLGVVFGTPEYMAPEQAMGESVDGRADLYALGVILYEMLTGVLPFEAPDAMAMLAKHISSPVPTFAAHAAAANVPAAVEALTMHLLKKRADERFTSARELLEAIDTVAREEQFSLAVPLDSLRETRAPHATPLVPRTEPATPTARAARGVSEAAAVGAAKIWLARRLRRMNPRGLVLVAAASFVALVIAVGLLASRGSARHDASALESPAPATGLGSFLNPAELSRARIDDAARQGILALEALRREYPNDPRLLRELVRAYSADGHGTPAMRTLGTLLRIDPNVASEALTRDGILAALAGPPDAENAAMGLLEGPLGARGVDQLIDLEAHGPVSLRPRCAQSLARPDVRAHASPAAAVLLDFHNAHRCESKYALLARARESGDERLLSPLRPLMQVRGCGFLGLRDCWSCLHQDSALRDAVVAIEVRGSGRAK